MSSSLSTAIYSDDTVANAVQKGSKDAFTWVYIKYANPLFNHAVMIVGSIESAEDIVQDLFSKLWESHVNLNITTSISAYLVSLRKLITH